MTRKVMPSRGAEHLLGRLVLTSSVLVATSGCSVFEVPTYQPGRDAGSFVDPTTADDDETDESESNVDAGGEPGGANGEDQDTDAGNDTESNEQDAGEPVAMGCVLPGIDIMDECSGSIVINEIDGSGDDFIEIYNRGETAVNISGYVIADDSGGSPDVGDGVVVPTGVVLEPGRFLYVWANLPPSADPSEPVMLRDDCIAGAPPPCLHTDWGVSAGGERVYLLNGALEIVCAVTYPDAIFGGEAFGRIPDGSSMVCPSTPTPGETNVASSLR